MAYLMQSKSMRRYLDREGNRTYVHESCNRYWTSEEYKFGLDFVDMGMSFLKSGYEIKIENTALNTVQHIKSTKKLHEWTEKTPWMDPKAIKIRIYAQVAKTDNKSNTPEVIPVYTEFTWVEYDEKSSKEAFDLSIYDEKTNALLIAKSYKRAQRMHEFIASFFQSSISSVPNANHQYVVLVNDVDVTRCYTEPDMNEVTYSHHSSNHSASVTIVSVMEGLI